jgi:hypothetical protein
MTNNIVQQYTSKNTINIYSLQNVDYTSKIKNKHYPAATREWRNSSYKYAKNVTVTTVVDNSIFYLLKAYFNSTPMRSNISKMFKGKSILKIFLGKLGIKNSINKVAITVPIYNKQKIYFWNLLKKSFQLSKSIAYNKTKVHLTTKVSINNKIKPLTNSFDLDIGRIIRNNARFIK